MGGWLADLEYAVRGLRRAPGFAAVAIACCLAVPGGGTAFVAVVALLPSLTVAEEAADPRAGIAAMIPGLTPESGGLAATFD